MATPEFDANYLFIGEKIVQRLRDQVVQIPPSDVIQIEQMAQSSTNGGARSPVAFVLWEGDQIHPADSTVAQWHAAQGMHQLWSVLLYIRNASQIDPDARNTDAGLLMGQIHRALAGWCPPGGTRPMRRVQGRPAQYKNNSSIYPLTFSVALHF